MYIFMVCLYVCALTNLLLTADLQCHRAPVSDSAEVRRGKSNCICSNSRIGKFGLLVQLLALLVAGCLLSLY